MASDSTEQMGGVMQKFDVPGPWDDEPDREESRWCGLPVLVKRGPSGAWCGYVGVPPGHPWHGKSYGDALCGHDGCYEHHIDVDVHGGLTYAAPCDGNEGEGICHVPHEGEPADVWWLGFDCAHAWDISPRSLKYGPPMADEVYRDLAYVTTEARKLAEQVDAAFKV